MINKIAEIIEVEPELSHSVGFPARVAPVSSPAFFAEFSRGYIAPEIALELFSRENCKRISPELAGRLAPLAFRFERAARREQNAWAGAILTAGKNSLTRCDQWREMGDAWQVVFTNLYERQNQTA